MILVDHRCFSAQLEFDVSKQQIYPHPSDLLKFLLSAYRWAEPPHPLKLYDLPSEYSLLSGK